VGVADLQLGVSDSAVGLGHAKDFGSAENALIVLDGLGGTLDDQVKASLSPAAKADNS
jgi:hypothetical protein